MKIEHTVLPATVSYKPQIGFEGIDAKRFAAEAKKDPLSFFQDRLLFVILAIFAVAALAVGLCLSGVPVLAQVALYLFLGVAALFVIGIFAMAFIGTKQKLSERKSQDR